MGLTVKNLVCRVRVTLPLDATGQEPGRSLDLTTLARMRAMLGGLFDDVRIHTSARAAALARALEADAFIAGKDVYFGEGRFDVSTSRGLALLAHELVHRRQDDAPPDERAAEEEALRAERRAAAPGPSQDLGMDGDPPERAAGLDETREAKAIAPAPPAEASVPGHADLEEVVAAKVLALMRAELVVDRERRGLTGSAGSLPL
jgi:hypothetical protein